MDAEVNQRAAAGLCLGGEPAALARNAAAADPAAAPGVQLAGLAVGDVFFQILRGVDMAVVAHDHQHLAGFFRSTLHLFGLFDVDGVGLLGKNVFAGFQRGDGDDGMQVVRRADVDTVDVRTVDDVLIVCVDVSVREGAVAKRFCTFQNDIAEGDDLDGIGHFQVLRDVDGVADAAVADDGDA